jgi:hypothetical protein
MGVAEYSAVSLSTPAPEMDEKPAITVNARSVKIDFLNFIYMILRVRYKMML